MKNWNFFSLKKSVALADKEFLQLRRRNVLCCARNKMSDQLKDLRKLCILNAKETETDDDIRNVCEEFGQLVGFNRPPNNRRLAFPLFKSPR